MGGWMYFVAKHDSFGRELWKTDGTPAGTQLVKNIWVGANTSSPGELTNVNGTLYFSASSPDHGRELWKSDGTAAGTTLVKDIFPGHPSNVPSSKPTQLTNVDGTLYFNATDAGGTGIWKSDGTAAGTVLVTRSVTLWDERAAVGSTLFFVANSLDGHGEELWKTDGTAAGTVRVKDIRSGPVGSLENSSYPSHLTEFGGVLYFSANDGVHGSELWRSDGTEQGTYLFKDANPGFPDGSFNNASPGNFETAGDRFYFSAFDLNHGRELWVSDGTTAGTRLVKDISAIGPFRESSITYSYSDGMADVNGVFYFQAQDPVLGAELWRTDGTAEGTTMVKDISLGIDGSKPWNLVNVGGKLYFNAQERSTFQLWTSDGTHDGTVLVSEVNTFPDAETFSGLWAAGGTLFFLGNDGQNGNELWVLPAPGPPRPGDYNRDDQIDGADFLLWQRQLGAAGSGLTADNDWNSIVEGADLAPWRFNLGQAVVPPGDFDGDRHVNGTDFLLWQRQLGAAGPALTADSDGNNIVNQADLAPWRAGGNPSSAAIAASVIAEPEGTLAAVAPFTLTHATAVDLALAEFQFAQATIRPAYRPRAARVR